MDMLKLRFRNNKGETKKYICKFNDDGQRLLARTLLNRHNSDKLIKSIEKGLDFTAISNMKLDKVTLVRMNNGHKVKNVVSVDAALAILDRYEKNVIVNITSGITSILTLTDNILGSHGATMDYVGKSIKGSKLFDQDISNKIIKSGKKLMTNMQYLIDGASVTISTSKKISEGSHIIKSRKKVKK
jgi:hypothetical protein